MALFKPVSGGNVDIDLTKFLHDINMHKNVPAAKFTIPDKDYFLAINKNANASADYGTNIIDATDSNNFTRLVIGNGDDKFSIEKIVDGGLTNSYAVYHEGNLPKILTEEEVNVLITAAGSGEIDLSEYLKTTGGTMTGVLNFSDDTGYTAIQKIRSVNDLLRYIVLGAGSDTTKGGSASLRINNENQETVGRLDIWEDGGITYKNKDTGYLPIGRIEAGSYSGTGASGSSTNGTKITFSFVPKIVFISRNSGDAFSTFVVDGAKVANVIGASGSYLGAVNVVWSGTELTLWTASGDAKQFNTASALYHYIAFE